MRHKRQLVAGMTASGAILCLKPVALSVEQKLSLRVESIREKLGTDFPALKNDARQKEIENIVQFFNCFRPPWRNC